MKRTEEYGKRYRNSSNEFDDDFLAGWGAFLKTYLWDHFATLTVRNHISQAALRKQFGKWIRKLEEDLGRSVHWFMVLECSRFGQSHVHALTGGTQKARVSQMRSTWGLGATRIVCYDPLKDAAFYVSKSLHWDQADYDISDQMPPLLRRNFSKKR